MSEGTIAQVLERLATWSITQGDCRELMKLLPDNSIDFIGTDAPYHLTQASRKGSPRKNDSATPFGRHAIGEKGFMGRTWDGGGVAFDPATWAEALRVAKPGAHLMCFGGSRTFGRLMVAIEDAGWEIRDSLLIFCHGEGFPKGTPQLKGSGLQTALKPAVEPIVLARKPFKGTVLENIKRWGTGALNVDACRVAHAGAADLAAHVAQVEAIKARGGSMAESWKNSSDLSGASDVNSAGRWPPNLLLQHHPSCQRIGTSDVAANPTWDTPNRNTEPSAFTGSEVSKVRHANGRDGEVSADKRYNGQGSTSFAPLPGMRRDDTETVEHWECIEGCPVRELSLQSGERVSGTCAIAKATSDGYRGTSFGAHTRPAGTPSVEHHDAGSAARYFPQFSWSELDDELALVTPFRYLPKPSTSETEAGLEHFRRRSPQHQGEPPDGSGVRNPHPTKKSVELVRWLLRLGCPRGGLPLDIFNGTAPFGVAALLEGLRYLGFELHDDEAEPYVEISRARLHHVEGRELIPRESLRTADPPRQASLFSLGESVSTAARAQGDG